MRIKYIIPFPFDDVGVANRAAQVPQHILGPDTEVDCVPVRNAGAKQPATGSGTVTKFEPGEIIVVGSESGRDTFSYVFDDAVRYVNKAGRQIDEHLIKPGSRVHVYYDNTGETPVVNRVVADEMKRKTRKVKATGL